MVNRRRNVLTNSVLFLLFLSVTSNAKATTLTPVTIQQMVKESELIFQGIVTKIEYRTSDQVTKDDAQLAHTFVTFKIETLFKGTTQNKDHITLRFAGGRSGDKEFIMIPGIPLFDLGDRDVLFVVGNSIRLCPLVGWNQGRFRIIDGDIYSSAAKEIWLTDEQSLMYGKTHLLEDLLTHKVSKTSITSVEIEEECETKKQIPRPKGKRLTRDTFASFLSKLVRTLHTKDELSRLEPVVSADIREKFFVRLPPTKPEHKTKEGKQ